MFTKRIDGKGRHRKGSVVDDWTTSTFPNLILKQHNTVILTFIRQIKIPGMVLIPFCIGANGTFGGTGYFIR